VEYPRKIELEGESQLVISGSTKPFGLDLRSALAHVEQIEQRHLIQQIFYREHMPEREELPTRQRR